MPDLSVIIPTNTISHRTYQTVNSINLEGIKFEILIIIDSCCQIDYAILDKLSLLNYVKIIKSKRPRGIAETLNCGISSANSELIMRLDDGDISLRKNLVKELELLNHYDLVCSPMVVKGGFGDHSSRINPRIIIRNGQLSPFSRVPHPTWVFKKNKIKFLYKPEDHRCEDFGFLFRNNFTIASVERAAVQYDISNKLNYVSELKSVLRKWKICVQNSKSTTIFFEATLYLIIRAVRLTLTTRKVL